MHRRPGTIPLQSTTYICNLYQDTEKIQKHAGIRTKKNGWAVEDLASIRSTAGPSRSAGFSVLGLGQQVEAMQAPGWGSGQPYKREGRPLVMEGMWEEGLRSVCLPLDTRITLRGGNS